MTEPTMMHITVAARGQTPHEVVGIPNARLPEILENIGYYIAEGAHSGSFPWNLGGDNIAVIWWRLE
jgi:hypothetical protein